MSVLANRDRLADLAVHLGDDAEQLRRLPIAARKEQGQPVTPEHRLGKRHGRDNSRLARLPRAVEKELLILAVDHVDLPGIGLQAEMTHELNGRRPDEHGAPLDWTQNGSQRLAGG